MYGILACCGGLQGENVSQSAKDEVRYTGRYGGLLSPLVQGDYNEPLQLQAAQLACNIIMTPLLGIIFLLVKISSCSPFLSCSTARGDGVVGLCLL